jgi:hypothetical protein
MIRKSTNFLSMEHVFFSFALSVIKNKNNLKIIYYNWKIINTSTTTTTTNPLQNLTLQLTAVSFGETWSLSLSELCKPNTEYTCKYIT